MKDCKREGIRKLWNVEKLKSDKNWRKYEEAMKVQINQNETNGDI